ncbi:MAG: hypothetical protein KA157_06785 [Aliarcobacter sp.]|nr:hypothetical protein [Aliarcobacter sp.]
MENSLLTILIVVVILIVIILIIREVNCWYWKINERVELQKRQNTLLESILAELKNESQSSFFQTEDGNNVNTKVNKVSKKGGSRNEEMIFDIELTTNEQKEVDAYVNFGIKSGELLVINKNTRKIEKLTNKEWEKLDQSQWIILIEN